MAEIMDQCSRLKASLEGINNNISKVADIQQQMEGLSAKGFNVTPSIDSLEVQKKQYTDFINEATIKLEELVKQCEDMALNIQ